MEPGNARVINLINIYWGLRLAFDKSKRTLNVNRKVGNSCEHAVHDIQGAFERIENEAEDFQRYRAEKCLIIRFAQDDRCGAITLRQFNVTFRNFPLHLSSISKSESHCSLGLEANGFPILLRQQGINCTAIHEEINGGFLPFLAGYGSFYKGNAHGFISWFGNLT